MFKIYNQEYRRNNHNNQDTIYIYIYIYENHLYNSSWNLCKYKTESLVHRKTNSLILKRKNTYLLGLRNYLFPRSLPCQNLCHIFMTLTQHLEIPNRHLNSLLRKCNQPSNAYLPKSISSFQFERRFKV